MRFNYHRLEWYGEFHIYDFTRLECEKDRLKREEQIELIEGKEPDEKEEKGRVDEGDARNFDYVV